MVYPNGGYISYSFGAQTLSLDTAASRDANNGICEYHYDAYALQHRYVSYDGSTIALQQDFAYTTQWNQIDWATKTTTVTTHDERR